MDMIFRWTHLIFGITWVGLLYYFNFVQTEYFKEAEPAAKADAMAKLAPRALWWFRWAAMFTLVTGLVLLIGIRHTHGLDAYIVMGVLAGIIMFLNVWLIIWPKQQIVLGMKAGDKPSAAAKAGLASRTNTLLSAPMLLGMLGSSHGTGAANTVIDSANGGSHQLSLGLIVVILAILAIEANALFGKAGPIASVKGVIHMSIALSVVFLLLLQYL
jgi:uncharacterized membrane protein